MAGDLVRFVDSIAASPTVRLDVNDEVSFWVKSFSAPPPRIRRSQSSNAMRDGIHVSSSQYDSRTVTMVLELRKSTQDAHATEMQKLFRELDRATNYLMYQPTGATKPVFFKLYRSDTSQLEDVMAQTAMRTFTVELLAEPFALGLRETLGPYTVNNDPAHATNGNYFDVSGVLGDVAAEPVLWWSTGSPRLHLGVSHAATAIPFVWSQAELASSMINDTTIPGGGPDAAMSGTAANNFARTSFATVSNMAARISFSDLIPIGSWRLIVGIRRSDSAGVINLKVQANNVLQSDTFVTENDTDRHAIDLGIVTSTSGAGRVGQGAVLNATEPAPLALYAERASGTSTLDWDYVLLLPVGGQAGELAPPQSLMYDSFVGGFAPVIDATLDLIVQWSGGDPSVGTSTIDTVTTPLIGAMPTINPGMVNRFYVIHEGLASHAKATALTVNVAYWPRYLFVRPSAT